MSDVIEATGTGRQTRAVAIAAAWRAATSNLSFVPLPQGEVRAWFERLAADALDALRADVEPEATLQSGRRIGRTLVELNLAKPKVLEATLACLNTELPSVGSQVASGLSVKLGLLLAGIAGGFAEASEVSLLAQQEAIKQASTRALRRTQQALEESRDKLAVANRELSEQVAERTRAEAMQRDLAERLQHLHEIDLAILSADSLAAILDISLAHLESLIPAVSIAITELDIVNNRSTILRSTHPAYPSGRQLPVTMIDEMRRLNSGEIIYIADLNAIRHISPGVAEVAEIGGHSLIALPIRYRDELIGSLFIILAEVREFSAAEKAATLVLSSAIGVAIQNRRLLEAEQESRRREATLRQVAAALNLGLPQAELLQLVLEQLERVVPTFSSSILLIEENGNPVLTTQSGGIDRSEIIGNLLSKRPRSIWTVLETGQPYVINDTHKSPDWVMIEGFEVIRAWLGVPLLVNGECIGIMTIDRDQPQAFTTADRDLAMAFASQAAIAIDNARLLATTQAHAGELEQRVRERTRELELLYGITTTAVNNPDMEMLLQRSMELTIDAFGCAAASVYLIEGEQAGLQLAAWLDNDNPELGDRLRQLDTGSRCLSLALHNGRPVMVAGKDLPADWPPDEPLLLVSVPLRSRGRNQGVLCLLCHPRETYSDQAPALLMTIADQIGAAVENIKLYQIARHSAIIEERERLAREIHDQVTQSIYSAALFAEAARGAAEVDDHEKLAQHIGSIQRMTNQALRELRLALFEFRTEALARKGLVDALRERLNTVEHRAGIAGEVHTVGIDLLPMTVEETFYRIAMEALNNALRHARADRVDIALTIEHSDLIMTIVDNGIGFNREVAIASGGMGLDGMHKRISKINGVLTVTSNEEGTWVTARAPLQS